MQHAEDHGGWLCAGLYMHTRWQPHDSHSTDWCFRRQVKKARAHPIDVRAELDRIKLPIGGDPVHRPRALQGRCHG